MGNRTSRRPPADDPGDRIVPRHRARSADRRPDAAFTVRARRAAGFTLIELLVVLVIVGVVLGTITLAIGGSGARDVENAARRAQMRIALACERAVIGGYDIGFSLIEDRLRFGYLTPQGWQPFAGQRGEELRERTLGDGMTLVLQRDGLPLAAADEQTPQLACYASGELTPFELQVSRSDAAGRWRVQGQLDGRVEVEHEDGRG